MKALDNLFTEVQVEEVSEKILKSTIEKIKAELSDKFYNEMNSFIYEHYKNASDEIHEKLIKEITDEFISDPRGSVFSTLRQKLFNENKELLISVLTDEAIEKSVESVIWQHIDKNYYFNWKWEDAILRVIGENWHKFKDDERVNNGLLRQIENLKSQVNNLQAKLDDCLKDENKTFIYCDPPYLGTNDNYSSSFTEQDSIDLFDCLQATGCKFAMSEFDNEFILNQAKERGLNVIIIGERKNLKNRRTEILITNY